MSHIHKIPHEAEEEANLIIVLLRSSKRGSVDSLGGRKLRPFNSNNHSQLLLFEYCSILLSQLQNAGHETVAFNNAFALYERISECLR